MNRAVADPRDEANKFGLVLVQPIRQPMSAQDEARYVCPACGEEIAVPIDVDEGRNQSYVEDCPVCCSPVVLRVQMEEDGDIRVEADAE
jgi:predicted RNA-binding Zn-ribbon protein involved in translation (DUF1610 family)